MRGPKYPTRNGLALSPYEIGYTQPTGKERKGNIDNHHLYFPHPIYTGMGALALTFCNLQQNVFPMLKPEHHEPYGLHGEYSAPPIPSFDKMVTVMEEELDREGYITRTKGKKTNEIVIVYPEEFAFMVKKYRKTEQPTLQELYEDDAFNFIEQSLANSRSQVSDL